MKPRTITDSVRASPLPARLPRSWPGRADSLAGSASSKITCIAAWKRCGVMARKSPVPGARGYREVARWRACRIEPYATPRHAPGRGSGVRSVPRPGTAPASHCLAHLPNPQGDQTCWARALAVGRMSLSADSTWMATWFAPAPRWARNPAATVSALPCTARASTSRSLPGKVASCSSKPIRRRLAT